MRFWLPNRILQCAVFLCLAACLIVGVIALNQPWLGLKLAAADDGSSVRIVSVHPEGPSRRLSAGAGSVAIAPAPTPDAVLPLVAEDVVEEPDMLETYPDIAELFRRQSALSIMLAQGPVEISAKRADGTISTAIVQPSRRPLSDLPSAFWVQLVTGVGSVLIGAWVLALRPNTLSGRLFALSGAMIMLSAFSAAIYSSRELAIPGGLFAVLSAFNHIGALGFGAAMICLFLIYPRRLVPLWALWIVPAIVVPWQLLDILHLPPNPAIGAQLPTLLEMLGIILLVGVQRYANRNDPRGRAVLRWLGLSVIVGSAPFILLIVGPLLFGSDAVMQQGHAFGFFLLIYAGLALGVSRYRLFDLDRWSFRVMFYTGGLLALLAVDALLILALQLQPTTSLGLSLLAIGFLYLPMRGALWDRFVARRRVENHELFRSVIDVSFAASAGERSERWRALLQELFDPLSVEPIQYAATDAQMRREGLDVVFPAVADTPALLLRYCWRGQRLFGTVELQLAQQLVRMMRYTEEGRTAYERGRTEERGRIARDLHDDVGALLLSGLHKTDLDGTHRVLRDAIADIRTIVGGLSADHLPLAQVVAALRHETGERLDMAGIALDWALGSDDDAAFALDYRLYRSLISVHREIVSNIIRHSSASVVEIDIGRDAAELVMRIADNGIGIDIDRANGVAQTWSNGLRGMARRISELQGTLAFPDMAAGTCIEVRLPVGEASFAPKS